MRPSIRPWGPRTVRVDASVLRAFDIRRGSLGSPRLSKGSWTRAFWRGLKEQLNGAVVGAGFLTLRWPTPISLTYYLYKREIDMKSILQLVYLRISKIKCPLLRVGLN